MICRQVLDVGSNGTPTLEWHRQGASRDPVDEDKMRLWFGREANLSYVAREISGTPRLIQVYGPEAPRLKKGRKKARVEKKPQFSRLSTLRRLATRIGVCALYVSSSTPQ